MIKEIEKIYFRCCLCPWNCKINRFKSKGRCLLDWQSKLIYYGIIYGEEEIISPSYGIYFAGCNLKCSFCIYKQYQDNPLSKGKAYDFDTLTEELKQNKSYYKTISFIGGEPSINLLPIVQILQNISSFNKALIVLNSNMYFSEQAREVLSEIVDIFIANFHFGNEECAYKISGAFNYIDVLKKNIQCFLYKRKKIIIRHLLLPGHIKCCLEPILKFCQKLEGIDFNLMLNYVPCNDACKNDKIHRKINEQEKKLSLKLLKNYGFSFTEENKEINNELAKEDFERGKEQEIIIDKEGSVIIKHLSKDMLILIKNFLDEQQRIKDHYKNHVVNCKE